MKHRLVHSDNKYVQKVLDFFSIIRQNLFREGTTRFWIYDRLFKQIALEILHGNRRRARYVFVSRFKAFINQGFKIEDYLDWIYLNEPSLYELKEQAEEAARFSAKPLISIVTPVYHPPASVLSKTLDSVSQQSYPYWEHCVVNADPADHDGERLIGQAAQKDKRVIAKTLAGNQGIAGNTNAAIQMANGEWIAFLDHDDQLAPFALYEMVKLIDAHPDADVIYSDEDKLRAADQHRFSPFFKPDFNLDYLRSLNYMTHFLLVRKSLGDAVGWLDPAYDGAQDHDLVLKLAEKTDKIYHLPQILYHWKMAEGSTAGSTANKPYALDAGERALNDHLRRGRTPGSIVPGSFPYQARYAIQGEPKVSMIIPSQDHCPTLKRLLDSLFQKTTYPNYEIIVVENGSREPETFAYYESIQKDPRVTVIEWAEEFNYSLVNNFGARHASGEVLLLLNNDLEVINGDWVERMLEHAQRPEIGAVGAKLLYPNNTIQHAGVIVGMFGAAGHSQKFYPRKSPGYYNRLVCAQNYSAVTAACLMIRRAVFDEVGGLDPEFKLEFGDVDFCLRILQKGYRNLWTPFAELYHHESLTRGSYTTREKKQLNRHEVTLFKSRWGAFIERGDPSYNSNLTHAYEDFAFNMG